MPNATDTNGQFNFTVGRFSPLDYGIFAAMLVISALIGLFYAVKARRQATTSEFFLGGRQLSVFPVAMSVLASFMSAITLLGNPADVYQYGTMYFMINVAFILVIPATAYLYLPVFFELQVTSAYEYLEKRFNRCLRTMGCIIFTIHMLLYMPLVLYAPSLALAQVTGLNLLMSVLSIGIVCTFYTAIGGIRAVVITDLFQTAMMYLSLGVIVFKGAIDEGGFDVIWKRNYDGQRIEFFNFNLDPTVRHTIWGLAIGGYCTWMGNYAVNQAMVQRYLTLPNLSAARQCLWINLPFLWLLIALATLAGMVVYGRYFECDPLSVKMAAKPDQLFPLFVMDTLSNIPGLPGLFVSGVFSGALSTVSSGVNSLAAVALEDIIKPYIIKDLTELWATRITKILAVGYGLLAIILVYVASQLGDVLQAGLIIHGVVGGPMLGVYTLGMFFPWTNSLGAALGLFAGFAVSFWIGMGSFAVKPPIPKLPISIDACPELYFNVTGRTHLPDINAIVATRNTIFYPYRISYLWFSAIGFVTVLIVGILVSFLTGRQKTSEIDGRLITPIMRKFYRFCKIDIKKHTLKMKSEKIISTIATATPSVENGNSIGGETNKSKNNQDHSVRLTNYRTTSFNA